MAVDASPPDVAVGNTLNTSDRLGRVNTVELVKPLDNPKRVLPLWATP